MSGQSHRFLGITSTFRIAQGHNTAEVGIQPLPLAPGVRGFTTRTPRSPPIIVGILKFKSMINLYIVELSMKQSLTTSTPGLQPERPGIPFHFCLTAPYVL